MPEIHTEIRIQASPEAVWSVLCCDAQRMADLNPQILRIRGQLREGSTIRLRVRFALGIVGGGKANVLRVDPPRLLQWRGGLPIPGLFFGDHSFEIFPEEDGVRLVQREVYRGLLAPILLATIMRGVEAGFRTCNERVKELAEAMSEAP